MMALDDVSRILPLHLDFLWHGNCCGPAGGCGSSSMSGWSSRALPSHWVLDLQGKCLLQVVEIIFGILVPWKGVAWGLTIVPTGWAQCLMLLDGRMIQRPLKPEPDSTNHNCLEYWIAWNRSWNCFKLCRLVEPFVQFLVAHSDSKMDV